MMVLSTFSGQLSGEWRRLKYPDSEIERTGQPGHWDWDDDYTPKWIIGGEQRKKELGKGWISLVGTIFYQRIDAFPYFSKVSVEPKLLAQLILGQYDGGKYSNGAYRCSQNIPHLAQS